MFLKCRAIRSFELYNIFLLLRYNIHNKDMEDARHLRMVYSDKINEKEINEIKKLIRKIRLREE